MAHYNSDFDAEKRPIIDRMDREYKIFVDNLPEELNEDAIREIFANYGTITGMFYRRKATWAYITFSTYREAEYAIRELNGKKPLDLKVALAKERSNESEVVQSIPGTSMEKPTVLNSVNEPLVNNDVKYQQGIGRGVLRKCFVTPPSVMSHKSAENSRVADPYESDGPFVSTNRLWTRGTITVTSDGKRHVSLGRGYTLYEMPEQTPKIEDYILKVYDSRKNGLYECAEDKLKNAVKKCLVCFHKTTKHCEKCNTYYCSKNCQVVDWPRHQAECERIP